MQQLDEPWVDLAFALTGRTIPLDHGYQAFSAIARVLSDVHGASWLKVHPIRRTAVGSTLRLERDSTLRVRVVASRIPSLIPLAGKRLELSGHPIQIGVPTILPLSEAPVLSARMVAIKLL